MLLTIAASRDLGLSIMLTKARGIHAFGVSCMGIKFDRIHDITYVGPQAPAVLLAFACVSCILTLRKTQNTTASYIVRFITRIHCAHSLSSSHSLPVAT
jgi:hypothetical protein